MRDFLSITDLTGEEVTELLDRADELQDRWRSNTLHTPLAGRRVALWFAGSGFRNRLAFEIGARALGAEVSYVPGDLGVNEPIEDIGPYLNNWFDMAVVRCRRHDDLIEFATRFSGPVVNARTDHNHPCEILSDLQYIRGERGSLEGLSVVFVGEVTNLCMSWFEAASRLPIDVTQVAPEEYLIPDPELRTLQADAAGSITTSADLDAVLSHRTDVIYTDCWPSADDKEEIAGSFLPYQITAERVERINPDGFFLPCPPVTRGEEVAADALLLPQCKNYEAKECLLHTQNAIMKKVLSD